MYTTRLPKGQKLGHEVSFCRTLNLQANLPEQPCSLVNTIQSPVNKGANGIQLCMWYWPRINTGQMRSPSTPGATRVNFLHYPRLKGKATERPGMPAQIPRLEGWSPRGGRNQDIQQLPSASLSTVLSIKENKVSSKRQTFLLRNTGLQSGM